MGVVNRLNTTVVVKNTTRTADGIGGFTISYDTSITSLSARISINFRATNTERNLGDQVQGQFTYKVFTRNTTATAAIKMHQQMVHSSGTYEIVGIQRPSRGAHMEFDAEIIEYGA